MKFNIKHNNAIILTLISFCLIAFMACAYSAETNDTYIEIGTKAELEAFRDRVNAGETTLNAKLMADIDLAGSEDDQWTPIGIVVVTDFKAYKGIFDGNGHTISGLYINKQSDGRQGLFGFVNGARIKNVTVSGSITIIGSSSSVGGICGEAYNSTVTNCVSKVTVKGSGEQVGGICGSPSSSTISNCMNEGSITGDYSVGGIYGRDASDTTITNCVNEGSITGDSYVGGICGWADSLLVDNADTTITNCVNKGSVTGGNSTGGICGVAYFNNTTTITITSCVNEGSVTGSNSEVGGICGYAFASTSNAKTLTIENCMNTATVSGPTHYTGGVIGCCSAFSNSTINITNCGYATGTAEKAIGYQFESGGVITVTETKEYAEDAIPATAAIVTLDSLMQGAKKPAVTIYPENAYNKESVSYALSSSDTAIATVSEGNVTGVAIGNATISGTISNLLGSSSVEANKTITVTQNTSSGNYKTTTDKQGGIPGETITAKIKIAFENLQEALIHGVQAVVHYATDALELVSAQKGNITGTYTPETSTAGEIGFGLMNMSGTEFTEGQYYDFGTMTFKIKQGATIGSINDLFITDATYMLSDYTENTATTTDTDIEIYQPVTSITITSSTGETTMLPETTLQLEAEVLPSTAHTQDIQWTSSDETKATIDANGLITAKKATTKTANITITAKALDGSGVTATKQITITRPEVETMNFKKTSYELTDDTATINLYNELNVYPEGVTKPQATAIQWESSNPNITIDTNGIVSIATPTEDKQETTITATYTNESQEQITTTCTVNIKAKKITLNLTTKLEGRQSDGGTGSNIEQIELYIYSSANLPLWNGTGTTDTNGKISFKIDTGLLEQGQTVKLWIKGARYLAQLTTATITLENDETECNITMSQALKAGDGNNDNKIGLQDFIIFDEASGTMQGETGYDARADYNGDDKIRLTDFTLLGRNYGQKGANKPEAAVTMFMTAAANRGTLNAAINVLNTQTTQIAEETLANSTATDQETQEEEILAAIQTATNAPLNATSAASTTDSSTSNNSSGGCNTGYGALALMFAVPVIFKNKKK